MKIMSLLSFLFLSFFTNRLSAQVETLSLWQETIPNSINNPNYEEIKSFEDSVLVRVSQVTIPTLTIYHPKKPNGTSIVICPGGSYHHLAMNKEGFEVAQWLNTLGITALVLKYRLPSDSIMEDKTIGPLQDAQEAIRFVRRHTEKWNLKKDKVGVLGFSAGGHLASTLSTHYDDDVYQVSDHVSAKPDFSILVYPVISMEDSITHKGSKTNLLGSAPSTELIEKYSNEKQVDSATPPTFLVHAVDDKSVPHQNSINYFMALNKKKIPTEMHLYQKGGHGFGMGMNDTSKYWTQHCEAWLRALLFIE